MHKSLAWPRRNATWTAHYSFIFIFHFFHSEVPVSRLSIEHKTPLNATALRISVTAWNGIDSDGQSTDQASRLTARVTNSYWLFIKPRRDAVDGERQTVSNHIYLMCFVWKGVRTEERKTSFGLLFAVPGGTETRKIPTEKTQRSPPAIPNASWQVT